MSRQTEEENNPEALPKHIKERHPDPKACQRPAPRRTPKYGASPGGQARHQGALVSPHAPLTALQVKIISTISVIND